MRKTVEKLVQIPQTVEVFQCDACGKQYDIPPGPATYVYKECLPKEWFMASQAKDREPYLFCSAQCLRDWAQKLAIIEYEKVN